jgi:putative transposase
VVCFEEDLEALLAVQWVPVRHRVKLRTTNLAERSFLEERRRTKVIPRLRSEKAALKLAFATMVRASERWCRVPMSDLERRQLELLRAELGLDSPPTDNEANRRRSTDQRVAA